MTARDAARNAALGRLAYGVVALAVPDATLRAFGTDRRAISRELRGYQRLFAVRDIAFGALTMWSRDDETHLRRALTANLISDAGDVLVVALAVREGARGRIAWLGFGPALGGLAAGLDAQRRLRGSAATPAGR